MNELNVMNAFLMNNDKACYRIHKKFSDLSPKIQTVKTLIIYGYCSSSVNMFL